MNRQPKVGDLVTVKGQVGFIISFNKKNDYFIVKWVCRDISFVLCHSGSAVNSLIEDKTWKFYGVRY